MSFAGLYTAHNFSLYAVPAAFAVAFAPHAYAMALYNKERAPGTQPWDGTAPKKNRDHVGDSKMSPYMQDRYLRAEAANDNGFVGLPFFAAAVVAGNVAGLPKATLNSLAATYLVSRIVFTYLYVNGTTAAWGHARSLSWLAGIISCCTLFVRAGNKYF
ncbi:hypothetical protein EHS25_002655 [Saitozyma podzolica]|uniref:Uncharacterized protein n=1 Tax=Saitozyma podzolica TaxID=1890683 RepID=A0A427YD57_9TREE|nr:hypothetical protein EHS25_002655 [Saitozyma podzolica]